MLSGNVSSSLHTKTQDSEDHGVEQGQGAFFEKHSPAYDSHSTLNMTDPIPQPRARPG